MIEANEVFIIGELREIGLSDKQIKEFLKRFRGWRVYFRKKRSEYQEIRDIYEQMIAIGRSRSEAIKELARIFEKSESRIRIITAEQKGLFDGF